MITNTELQKQLEAAQAAILHLGAKLRERDGWAKVWKRAAEANRQEVQNLLELQLIDIQDLKEMEQQRNELLAALKLTVSVALTGSESRLLMIGTNAPGFLAGHSLQDRCDAIDRALEQARRIIASVEQS